MDYITKLVRSFIVGLTFVAMALLTLYNSVETYASQHLVVTTEQLDGLLARAQREMDEGKMTQVVETLYEFERLADTPKSPATDHQRLKAYFLLASIHCVYSDFATAAVTYEKAIKLKELDPDMRIQLWGSYGLSLCFSGNLEKTRTTLQQLQNMPADNYPQKAYRVLLLKACIERQFGDIKQAAKYFEEALGYVKRGSLDDSMRLTCLSELSAYYSREQPDKALEYLHEYMTLSEKYHIPPMMAEARRGLVRTYMNRGDTLTAMRYVGGYMDVMDSVYKPDTYIALNSKRQTEHLRTAKSQIEDLEVTVSWQKILIVACLLILVIGICAVFLGKHFSEMRRALYARNRELAAMGREMRESRSGALRGSVPVSVASGSSSADFSGGEPSSAQEAISAECDLEGESAVEAYDDNASHNVNLHVTGAADGEVNVCDEDMDEEDMDASNPVHTERMHALMVRIREVLADENLYCDPDFSLPTLAKLVQSNTKYVSQAINEVTGDNFRTYINTLRIVKARERLTDHKNFGHLTIQSISESVGFRSSSNFITTFRKVTGLTPSVYVKMAKTEA